MTHDNYKSRILVVDDNQATLFLFKKILEKKFTLLSASGGKEALQILNEQEPPDLILSDIMMPEMSGYALFQEIKKDVRIASIPIIFVTALGSETDELKGLETGAVDYIIKPIEHNVLIARINNILELSNYQRDTREKLPEILGELFPDESIEFSSSSKPDIRSNRPSLVMIINPNYEKDGNDHIQQVLSEEYELIQFNSEVKAHQFITQEKIPDLILLDIDHSAQDRFEIIKQFKEDDQTQSVPLILLTSISSSEDETMAFQTGCADYISKPIVPPILRSRIRNHVELKKHRQTFERQLEAFLDD